MEENLIAEIRQLLEEMVVPDLKLLLAKVDGLQRQLELNRQVTQEHLGALQSEAVALRGAVKAFRIEMDAYRAEFRSQRGLPQEESSKQAIPGGDEQRVPADNNKKYRVN